MLAGKDAPGFGKARHPAIPDAWPTQALPTKPV